MDLCVSPGLEPEGRFCAQKGITVLNKQQDKACMLINVKADSFVDKVQVCQQRRETTAHKLTTVLLVVAFITMFKTKRIIRIGEMTHLLVVQEDLDKTTPTRKNIYFNASSILATDYSRQVWTFAKTSQIREYKLPVNQVVSSEVHQSIVEAYKLQILPNKVPEKTTLCF